MNRTTDFPKAGRIEIWWATPVGLYPSKEEAENRLWKVDMDPAEFDVLPTLVIKFEDRHSEIMEDLQRSLQWWEREAKNLRKV